MRPGTSSATSSGARFHFARAAARSSAVGGRNRSRSMKLWMIWTLSAGTRAIETSSRRTPSEFASTRAVRRAKRRSVSRLNGWSCRLRVDATTIGTGTRAVAIRPQKFAVSRQVCRIAGCSLRSTSHRRRNPRRLMRSTSSTWRGSPGSR